MKSKTLFANVILSMLMLISIVNAVDFYDAYEFSFTNGVPDNMIIESLLCEDALCSDAVPSNAEFFLGDAISCWSTGVSQEDFEICMSDYSVSGPVNLTDCDTISNECSGNPHLIVKYENIESNSFGFLNYFYTSGDSYLLNYDWVSGFNCEDENFCLNNNAFFLPFMQKTDVAIAEIGQVNVKNIDNPLLPIQVEVPVVVEESVCSAFRITQPNFFRPSPPVGYSDFSVDTLITLSITDVAGNPLNGPQTIMLPIEADTCAGLGAFSWTPDTSLENTEVKFSISTEIVDNQIANPQSDFMEVIETIYPESLDGACWTRAYDFTLSNVDNTQMSTSVSQIREGESLFAVFNAGAFRDNAVMPMNFEAVVLFDGVQVYDELLGTNPATTEDDLGAYSIDLTNTISSLASGSYDVTLITRPISSTCTLISDVTQTQNLEILSMEVFNVSFHVFDANSTPVEGAIINLELLNADDYFAQDPVYNENLVTDAFGEVTFVGAYRGDYEYFVSASGFVNVINTQHIGADTDISITMPTGNAAPVINLPDEVSVYYEDSYELDITNYVVDFNNAFADLTFESNVVSGVANVDFSNFVFTFSTDEVNSAVVEISVTDLDGANTTDSITINFVDNVAPVVNEFSAEPSDGNIPFYPNFVIDVTDLDNDTLTCSIDSGNGMSSVISDCANANSVVSFGYILPGTYTATLIVEDGVNEPVIVSTQVFAHNRTVETPLVNYFRLYVDGSVSSKSQIIVPANLELEWDVSHSGDYAMDCSLRIAETDIPVDCTGDYDLGVFNLTGIHRFSLVAIDNDSTQIVRTIEREFLPGTARLDDIKTDLIVEEVITPGEFDFVIESTDETLDFREISIRPIISCRDIDNALDIENGGLLDSSIVSRVDDKITTFNFKIDTQDFKLRVPTDENCEFKVILTDGLGSVLVLSKSVVFSYPVEVTPAVSISGRGTDVLDYIASTMSKPMDSGYNSISFNVVNNEDEAKELSITMTSAELDVEFSLNLNLGADQSREVQIPLYIGEDVEAGLYPVRFGVRDGDDKQVKYSYVLVE